MVIFGTGVVTGGLLVHHAQGGRDSYRKRPAAALRPTQAPSPGVMRIEFLRRAERELNLAPGQREPIDKVLKEGQERMKQLMEAVEPRRREEYKRTLEEFRALLTPEQRQRFDTLLKQQQRARDQRKTAPPRERSLPGPPPASPPATTNL